MRRLRDRRGSVAVEFALTVPIYLLLTLGIIDFGRAFYTLHDLAAAVREGARYAAPLADPLGEATEIRNVVKQFAVTFGGQAVTDGQIEIEFNGQSVTVRIRDYPFDFIALPFVSINLTREAEFRWERAI